MSAKRIAIARNPRKFGHLDKVRPLPSLDSGWWLVGSECFVRQEVVVAGR